MVPDWEANAVFFAASLPRELPAFWAQLEYALTRNGVKLHLLSETKDIWVRDFLPAQVGLRHFVKFHYEPDYLRGFDHLRTGSEVCEQLPFLDDLQFSPLRLDGGSLVTSPRVAIVTDKLYRENPGLTRLTLRTVLCELLGVERCLVIPAEPGDCFGHADGVVRFLDRHTVAVNDYSVVEPEYGQRLQAILRRAGLRVEPMPYVPDVSETDGIPSAAGNYVNYLRVGGLVFIPAYGTAVDALARQRLQALLPETRVIPVRCCALARRGGVLHCVSWNVRLPATAQVGWDSANPEPTGGAAPQRDR